MARSPPFLLWREAALTPDFQVQGAAFLRRRLPRRLGRTDARSESARTQRTPKKLGPDLVAVELFGAALEFSQIADR